MAAYHRRVNDSHRLQADCQEPGIQLRIPTLGNRVWATFTFYLLIWALGDVTATASDVTRCRQGYQLSRCSRTQM